ncbi:TonB-dependent receptor [Spongiibacter taiwanensis]|uniref:TonB-dependent receptor family protein n=1 Tax=Spongiibacter taiwanensis TaxID=1748242 RepID=UPI0020364EC3|nr:TonB-dependent receptor [Spongiibacter taiwanensis]USA44359.1 TonB-dependent receptor [Spongiibacter taiwanensis]
MSRCHPLFPHRALWFSLSLPLAATAQAADGQKKNLETLTVYGQESKLELEAEQSLTPGGVTLLDSADLFQRGAANLADMLRYVPGLWVASGSTGDGSYFSSRGSNLDAVSYDGNGVRLMQDGLPITAADGNNHNRTIDPLSTRYAVVARGANAMTYGAATLGGAIDFITPTARDSAPMEFYYTGGSDNLQQGRLTAGTVQGQFDGLITLESRNWDGYRDHQEQDRLGVYSNAGWQFSDAVSTRVYFQQISNDQELPGALTRAQWKDDPEQANPSNEVGHFLLNVDSWRLANKTVWDIDEQTSLTAGIAYEEQDLYHPIVFSPFFSLLIDTKQTNTATTLRYNARRGDHDVMVGLNYGVTEVEGGNYSHVAGVRTTRSTKVDNDAESLELFVVDRWKFTPQWTAVIGAQFVDATREIRNETVSSGTVRDPKGDYDSINPRVGVIYQINDEIALFANLSKLYEAPTLYELEDDARGNQETLNAMQGTVAEIGSRGSQKLGTASSWNWDVSLYLAHLEDEILSRDDPSAPGTSLSINAEDTLHGGLEALFSARVALGQSGVHSLNPTLNLTLNEFSFDGDRAYGDNELPVAPRHFIKGELLYRHSNGFFAGPTFDIVDERYADFANNYVVEGYELLGLRIGYSRETWEVWGELRNLTDKDYITQVSVKDSIDPSTDPAILTPGEGRAFYFGVRFQL